MTWHDAFTDKPPIFTFEDRQKRKDDLVLLYAADARLCEEWPNKNDVSIDISTGYYNHDTDQYHLEVFKWNPPSGFYYVIAWSNDWAPNIKDDGTKYILDI